MDVELAPEPPADVRRAIVQALAAVREDGLESAWWRAGVEEAAEDGARLD